MSYCQQYYKIVIHVIDSVYGFIYTAWAHNTARLVSTGHISTSRVYEPVYTVKNLYILYYTHTQKKVYAWL